MLAMGLGSQVAWGETLKVGEISRPRFASGDVDGDGIRELVIGGRVGPFRPVTDSPSSGRGRIEVYRREGRLFAPMGAGLDLNQVVDVACGDLDGDGTSEVAAVGGGRLVVFAWQAGSLGVRHAEALDGEWSDRVAAGDVDGDGRDELIVTLYAIGDEAELGQTSVVLYRLEAGRLRGHAQLDIPMHVGDLAIAGPGGASGMGLVLEVGAGDEGGEGRVYRFAGGHFVKTWGAPVTQEGTRALTVSGLGSLVAFLPVGGPPVIYGLEGGSLWLRGSLESAVGGGLVLTEGPQGATEFVSASGRSSPLRASPLAF